MQHFLFGVLTIFVMYQAGLAFEKKKYGWGMAYLGLAIHNTLSFFVLEIAGLITK